MSETSEAARSRKRQRQLDLNRLSILMIRFEAGQGGLDCLDEFLKANLILPDKLAAIDVAIRRKLIDHTDLSTKCPAPSPVDFGILSETKPTIIPKRIRAILDNPTLGLVALGASYLTMFVLLWRAGSGWFLSGFLALLAGPAALMVGLVGSLILIAICDNFLPNAAAYRRYRRAKKRHEVIRVASTIFAAQNDIHSFYRASGPEFERLVARAFRRWGFHVRELGGANDGGIDLVVMRGSETSLVQCKAFGRPVSPAVVRELYGTLLHSEASHAYLATLMGVTQAGRDWASGKPITFLVADDFINRDSIS